ncbi:MAG: UvrD-helicase domain-containing protein [Eubacteriales bacterium]|nr:UvrD-helicase domain-containing protein [Eubacteriales bacterium]
MADFRPTASQELAIGTRGSAVLVSAGAGSGKTKVLTERLMARLRDEQAPADLDSFLVITFTRAAAGELRGRILEELSAALAADPGNQHLRRQSALCRRAQIGTIHSFCASLLREFSHLAELSPDFKIADEDRAEAMKAAALERTLESCYAQPERHPGFLQLADTVGAGRDDRRLAALVLDLHSRMQCHAWPEAWAEEQVALLRAPAADAAETPWGREILRRASEITAYWSGEMERCLAAMLPEAKIAAAYQESFAVTADALRELGRCLAIGWDRARASLPIPFPPLGKLSKSPDPALSDQVKARRAACRKAAAAIEKMLDGDSAKLLADMAGTEPAMSALLDLVLLFDREYGKDKQRAGIVDYADLEHKAAQLLTERDGSPTELARRISQRYTEILVDEYQDVSRVQDAIFRAVSREETNLFLVGDVKQSIYRFRLADPEIFNEKYRAWPDAECAAPDEARRILLRENFRSRQEVLEGANAVFSLCMSRSLGDVDYDENAALIPGAPYEGAGAKPELLLLRLPDTEEGGERPDKAALEAQFTAKVIRSLMERGLTVTDHGRQRPLRWGDIAILLRSANTAGGVYRRALAREGVPVANGQGGGFFRSIEVSTLLSLLAVLDNPHQDIPLIAVLRSPAFGFTADDLSAIRSAARSGDLYAALCAAAEEDARCRDFRVWLDRSRREAPDLPAAELVWRLIEELDLLALCSAMSDGEQRRARLMALVTLSERFESSGYRGLHRFVLWLRRQAERGEEPALGADTGSAVQILSVHKSKGLEFPVVFLCDTGRRFNLSDMRDTVLVHPTLGLGAKVTDLERRVEYPTLARSAIRERLERETLSEEMRLLYVALTRAREHLYVTAALPDPERQIEKLRASLCDPMPAEALAGASAPVDWLLWSALADGGAHLRLRICESADAQEAEETAPAREGADPRALRELERRLSFAYPHAEAEKLPSKVTATGLKGRAEPDEDAVPLAPKRHRPFRMPDFSRKDRPATGAEKGTATHLVLQYMDFAKSDSPEAVREEIARLRALRFLSDREAAAVDADAIVKLFASPLGQRMRQAPAMRREFRFSLLCDASGIYGTAAGEELLLQGVVDCYLEEEDGLTVIDYKTDRLKSRAEAQKRAELYRGQLGAYASALERITGRPVKACVLYFLSVGEAVYLDKKD